MSSWESLIPPSLKLPPPPRARQRKQFEDDIFASSSDSDDDQLQGLFRDSEELSQPSSTPQLTSKNLGLSSDSTEKEEFKFSRVHRHAPRPVVFPHPLSNVGIPTRSSDNIEEDSHPSAGSPSPEPDNPFSRSEPPRCLTLFDDESSEEFRVVTTLVKPREQIDTLFFLALLAAHENNCRFGHRVADSTRARA